MNNTCKIVINGTNFYIPCDRVNDLDYLDGYLVNVSSSSLTMRSIFRPDSSNMYPYITCSAMSVCQLRSSDSQRSYIQSNYSYSGDILRIINPTFVIMFLLFVFLGVKLLWKR